jgi:hypothetical protein
LVPEGCRQRVFFGIEAIDEGSGENWNRVRRQLEID